jgi:LysM repeat protein
LTKYTVKPGDTLWGIAKKYLGDGNKYKEILKANGLKDTVIRSGMVLNIPSGVNNSTSYEDIGKAFEKALNDVDNLQSVKNLYKLIGE